MERIVVNNEDFGQAAMELSRDPLAVHETSINNLPPEVLELIFEELDSITRKKIERVCKGWMQIIRRSRKFRTHLKFELPSQRFSIAHPLPDFDFYSDLVSELGHLVKPEVEVLHFKPSKLPDINLDNPYLYRYIERIELHLLLMAFERAGVDLTKVVIVISDCSVDCGLPPGLGIAAHTEKTRILRSNIAVYDWFGRSTLYVEDLWLEASDKIPEQVGNLLLAENGPLTEAQADILRELRRHLTVNGEPDDGSMHRLADHLSHFDTRFMGGDSWIEVMMTVANGGHVSIHLADDLEDFVFSSREI